MDIVDDTWPVWAILGSNDSNEVVVSESQFEDEETQERRTKVRGTLARGGGIVEEWLE